MLTIALSIQSSAFMFGGRAAVARRAATAIAIAPNTANFTTRSMRILGHRGASHTAPENTLASVRSALGDGHGFEVDLQLLNDGTLIVLHDDTLERTAALNNTSIIRAPITTLRLQDVEDIDVGSWFGEKYAAERPPLFLDVLRELQSVPGDAHCFAELKGSDAVPHDPKLPGVAAAIISALRVPPSRLTWISSSFPLLMEMKALCPKHKCLYIADAADEKAAWRAAGVASKHSFLDGISLRANPSVVTAELCAWMRQRNKLVAVWVSRAPAKEDTPEVWSAMEEVGVDYFTSNLPPSLKVWQRRRRRSSDIKMAARRRRQVRLQRRNVSSR